jgi:hypothetical protein
VGKLVAEFRRGILVVNFSIFSMFVSYRIQIVGIEFEGKKPGDVWLNSRFYMIIFQDYISKSFNRGCVRD